MRLSIIDQAWFRPMIEAATTALSPHSIVTSYLQAATWLFKKIHMYNGSVAVVWLEDRHVEHKTTGG